MAISPTSRVPSGEEPLELKKTGVESNDNEALLRPSKFVVTVTVFN